jgi:hypothetical protein
MIYKGFLRLTIALIIFTFILAIFFVVTADGADLISQVVYEESRGESFIGQIAVAEVLRNRVNDPWWADTYEGVIYQDNQFALPQGKSGASAGQAVQHAVNGSDIVKGAQYFFSNDPEIVPNYWVVNSTAPKPKEGERPYLVPKWAKDLQFVVRIGKHDFYCRPQEIMDRGASRVLQYGDRGEAVEELQKDLGIEADGIYGKDTYEAVKAFQEDHGLTVDGIVGNQTRKKLTEV